MTDESTVGENGEQARKDWMNDAQDALQRAGDAIRAAWDASKPARASALDAARQAARELDDALERGMAAARERWDKSQTAGTPVGEEPAPGTPTAETSDHSGPAEEE
ncbi:MAG: hypothetical protein WB239_15035 [Acidimicrobiia bacterium]